jgi:cyclophilin family peptidyl-prolyl cis-trans isomerase
MISRVHVLALVLAAGMAGNVCAADDPVSPAGPAAQKFDELFPIWEKLFADVEAIQKKYPQAPAAEKPAMEEEYHRLAAEITKLAPEMVEASKAAYLESPNADENVIKMLLGSTGAAYKREDYELTMEMGKMLLDNKCPDLDMYDELGIAAFCTNDFATAVQCLQKAVKAGTISGDGRGYLRLCDTYRDVWRAERALRAKEAEADDLPRVKLSTSQGDMLIELFENEAPNTVANFISLVEKGYYDGLTFHRVLPNFMAQGGCPDGTGGGGPGYKIPCECYRTDHRKHFRGTLSMAHAGKDTGGSQFFLTFVPTVHLNGKHTVFGRVIDGMEVLSKIKRRDPELQPQLQPDKIVKATVVRKREHDYVPKRVE